MDADRQQEQAAASTLPASKLRARLHADRSEIAGLTAGMPPETAAPYFEDIDACLAEYEALVELHDEVSQLRDDLGSYVLGGVGTMWSLPMVLDELCRILADEVPDAD